MGSVIRSQQGNQFSIWSLPVMNEYKIVHWCHTINEMPQSTTGKPITDTA